MGFSEIAAGLVGRLFVGSADLVGGLERIGGIDGGTTGTELRGDTIGLNLALHRLGAGGGGGWEETVSR